MRFSLEKIHTTSKNETSRLSRQISKFTKILLSSTDTKGTIPINENHEKKVTSVTELTKKSAELVREAKKYKHNAWQKGVNPDRLKKAIDNVSKHSNGVKLLKHDEVKATYELAQQIVKQDPLDTDTLRQVNQTFREFIKKDETQLRSYLSDLLKKAQNVGQIATDQGNFNQEVLDLTEYNTKVGNLLQSDQTNPDDLVKAMEKLSLDASRVNNQLSEQGTFGNS